MYHLSDENLCILQHLMKGSFAIKLKPLYNQWLTGVYSDLCWYDVTKRYVTW